MEPRSSHFAGKHLRGFTLIELLVVVSIIGLLIAILLPSLGRARAQAYRVRCGTNLRALAAMDAQYAIEFDGFVARNAAIEGKTTYPSTFYLLAKTQRIPLAASTAGSGFESEYKDAFARLKWLNCPAFPKSDQPICFVVNGFNPDGSGKDDVHYVKISLFRKLSAVANFTEGNVNLPTDQFDLFDVWSANHLKENLSSPVTAGDKQGRILSDKRHLGMINVSYYDGHVDWRPYTQLALIDFVNN